MHVDYAREIYYKSKNPEYTDKVSDFNIIKNFCFDKSFIDFAYKTGDEKIRHICEDMRTSAGYGTNSVHIRKKMTSLQACALAFFLLDKYENAKSVIAKVFDIKEHEVDLKEDEI